MDRRVTLLIALAVVASLSGCSVLLGGDGSSPKPTAGPQGTDAPTPEPTTEPSASGGVTDPAIPAGTATDGQQQYEFDAAALNADHVAALEAAGSFSRQSSLVIRNASATRYINGSYAVERGGPAANTANITYVVDGAVDDLPPTTRYTGGGTTYERQVERTDGGTETRYRSGSEPYGDADPRPVNETVAYTLGQIARDVVDSSTWNRSGSGQVDGADVTRYDTSGAQFGVGLGADTDGAATLVVDESGVVRYVAYRFVVAAGGASTEYVYEAGYTGVGSTTVDEPAWTDEA